MLHMRLMCSRRATPRALGQCSAPCTLAIFAPRQELLHMLCSVCFRTVSGLCSMGPQRSDAASALGKQLLCAPCTLLHVLRKSMLLLHMLRKSHSTCSGRVLCCMHFREIRWCICSQKAALLHVLQQSRSLCSMKAAVPIHAFCSLTLCRLL